MDVRIGTLLLRPTEVEEKWAALGAGALALGLVFGSRKVATAGLLALAGVGFAMYEEAQTFTSPELMNGYFQTGGELSATRGAGEAAALALEAAAVSAAREAVARGR